MKTPKCDECNKKAVYYIGSKKNLLALLCGDEYCIEKYRYKMDMCECEIEKKLKELEQ